MEKKLSSIDVIAQEAYASFKCFRCEEVFARKFASRNDSKLCKYCEEFDDENGELKETV